MNNQAAQSKTLDLLTTIPGRSEARLLLNVDAERFDHVISQIAAAWGVTNLDRCVIALSTEVYRALVVITSQAEWTYLLSRDFFRVRHTKDEDGPLDLGFQRQSAPPSDEELHVIWPSAATTTRGSAEEQAAHRKLQSEHEAQAAEMDKLKTYNAGQAEEIAQLKSTIDAQAQEVARLNAAHQAQSQVMAAKSASLDELERRYTELNDEYTDQSSQLAKLETTKDAQARAYAQLQLELARVHASEAAQAQELAKLKSSSNVGSSRFNGKRSLDEEVSESLEGPAQRKKKVSSSVQRGRRDDAVPRLAPSLGSGQFFSLDL